ncbi:YSIRK-type signal peptide-containing protein [Streptococcus suis]|nr:YSIRK-type signal peptide-containing protein [Streptococcus suis]
MNLHFLQKKQHFGIRKFSIGVVSVALAISFSLAGGQVAAAQEASPAPISSQQTSQSVTDEPSQELATNEVAVQTPETVASSLNEATQENPAQESQLVEVEPAIQKEVVLQDISALKAALPAEAGQEQPAVEQVNENMLPAENSHQVIEPVEPESVQTVQEPAGSRDEATQAVQPTETAAVEEASTEQAVEEVVQPVLRSARRARSVAVTEVAKLPLDAQGQLMTSVSGATVHKFQVLNSDGSSQIVPAESQPTTSQTSDAVAQQVASLKADFAKVTYDSLYPYLSHRVSSIVDNELVKSLSQEKGGQVPTAAEKQTAYMDLLDMRSSFERVQTDLEQILTGVFEKAAAVNIDRVRAKKEQILTALSYLDRRYSFTFGNYAAKDLILFHPQVFGGRGDTLENLLGLANLTYQDLTMDQSANTYQRKLAPLTSQTDLAAFVEKGVSLFDPSLSEEEWFKQTTKAHIVEATNAYSSASLYEKIKIDGRLKNHLIPLLSLSSDSIYAISTSNTVNYGLKETYVNPSQAGSQQDFLATLSRYAEHQQEFLNFWYRMTQKKEQLTNHAPIIVVDSVQKYGQPPQSASELYSPKFGSKVLEGVREFIRPLNIYSNFFRADGQANGSSSVNLYLKKSLTDDGQSVYTHELTHILDKTIWLNGHGRRAGQGPEVYARGLFESINNSLGTAYDPVFNLNTAYTLTGNRTQNSLPTRFQTTEDMKTYMQGILDVLYTLDYAEAQSILNHSAEDRAVLLNKISIIPNPKNNGSGLVTERVSHIDTSLAASLTSIDDFINQSLISARYKFDGMYTVGTARTNSYYTIPLFEPIYAALQNNSGSVGDIGFKRNAYEILGEYGYENGMVAYLSNQYATDQAALSAIMPAYGGDLSAFKKAMFARRIAKVSELKPTSVASDFATIQTMMDQAVAKDLLQLKTNAKNNTYLSHRVTAVRDLKTSLYQAYLQDTNDFRTRIYQEQVARDLYVTNGDEKSQDGHGTLDNPYQSLSFALAQAKNGDRIKLVDNIMHRQDKPFRLDKSVTIDGQGHRLSFRGPDVELGADVTFAHVTLNMLADGSKQPNIYANGYHLTLDKVSTTMSQVQSDLRPTLVAGSRSGQPAGSHGKITILNGNSDTRFNTIYAGNADSVSNIPVTISILSDFVSVDQGIKLSGVNGEDVTEPVLVTSKSSSLKSIDGNGSWDNTVVIDTARIYGLNLQNIQTLELVNKADVSLANQVSEISTGLELESGTQLTIANNPVRLGNLSGQGTVIIPAASSLNVTGDIDGDVGVLVRGFEHELAQNVNKEYVMVEGMLSPAARITLENGFNRFDLIKDGLVYRLVEPTQAPQVHTVTLHFTQSGLLLKEKQVQVDDGQSITGVENDLPSAPEGSYRLDPNFDRTVLATITSSKTIEIPVVLVLPKASRYQPHVNGEARVLPTSSSEETKAEIVKQISLPADAGQFDVVVVTPIPQSSGDHSMTVRVIYDDRSEEELVVPLHILTIKNGEVVKHSLPVGVLPKADRYQPHVNGEARVLPTSSSEETKAEIVKQISLPAAAGRFDVVVVTPIQQSSGDHSMTVRVIYDDHSEEELVVPLHILTIKNGEVVKHSLPAGVLPKADRYQPQVNGEARVLPTSSSEETKAEIVKQINLPADAGQFDVVVVTPIPQSSGDYSMTVRVVYDDRSQEELVVPLHILTIKNGEVVKHSLPEGVLEPLVTAKGKGVTHELPVGILPPLETANGGGVRHELPAGVLEPLVTAKGKGVTHELPVGILPPLETANGGGVRHELPAGVLEPLVTAKGKGVTHELPVGILPPLETANGGGVRHELPVGVLEPLVTAKGKGVTHELPVGILPPLETANGGGVRHELPAGVLEPLVTAKGKGVTHELPIGILPPLETANGGALLHSLPTFSVDAIVQLLNAGHKISLGLLDGAIWSTGDGLDHSLPSLEIAKGSSVNHQLLEGTLPLMVTSKGASISHFLPEGILPLLVTAKGTGITHFIPSGTLPLTVTRSEAYTPAMPAASLLQQRQKNTETNPAVLPLVAVPQKQADQLSATLTSSNSATSTSNRLPETGERNNLSLLGFLLASLGFSFWIGRKKAE